MKKSSIFLIFGVFCLLATGCSGTFHAPTLNLNQTSTQVVLSGDNYKIIKQVKGSAVHTLILGFGGAKREDMVIKAREEMMTNVEMVGHSRAIINESIETYRKMNPFVIRTTIFVSAYVIEFTDRGSTPSGRTDQAPASGNQPMQPRW